MTNKPCIGSCRFESIILISFLFFFLLPVCSLSSQTSETVPDQGQEGENFFSRSEIICSSNAVIEGGTIVYKVIVRYDGPENSMKVNLVFDLSGPVMFVSSSPNMALLEKERKLNWEGEIFTKKDLFFTIELVTLPGSSSNGILLGSATIYWKGDSAGPYWQGGGQWLGSETKIMSKQRPAIFITSKGMEIGKVEIIALSYVTAAIVLTFVIPLLIIRREKRRGHIQPGNLEGKGFYTVLLYIMSFCLVVLLGIAHFMLYTVQQDFRRLVAYRQTNCMFLDKIITTHRASSASTTGRTQNTSSDFNRPLVAVSFTDADENHIVASGPPNPASMNSPIEKYALKELSQFKRGEVYPCWYDPQEPKNFVLIRGLSWGWYIIGAGPLLVLYFLARHILRRIRGQGDQRNLKKEHID